MLQISTAKRGAKSQRQRRHVIDDTIKETEAKAKLPERRQRFWVRGARDANACIQQYRAEQGAHTRHLATQMQSVSSANCRCRRETKMATNPLPHQLPNRKWISLLISLTKRSKESTAQRIRERGMGGECTRTLTTSKVRKMLLTGATAALLS